MIIIYLNIWTSLQNHASPLQTVIFGDKTNYILGNMHYTEHGRAYLSVNCYTNSL